MHDYAGRQRLLNIIRSLHHEESTTGSGIVTASSRVNDCGKKAALQMDMTVSADYHIRKASERRSQINSVSPLMWRSILWYMNRLPCKHTPHNTAASGRSSAPLPPSERTRHQDELKVRRLSPK